MGLGLADLIQWVATATTMNEKSAKKCMKVAAKVGCNMVAYLSMRVIFVVQHQGHHIFKYNARMCCIINALHSPQMRSESCRNADNAV